MSLAGALAELLTCIALGCHSDLEEGDDVESLPEDDGSCPVHGDRSLCSDGNIGNLSGDTQGLHIHNRSFLEAIDEIGNSFKHEMWRKWSTQSAGFSNAIFEAVDIVPSESRVEKVKDSMYDEMFKEAKDTNDTNYVPQDPVSGDKTNGVNHTRSCLLNLEAELASLFHLLRLRADALHEGHESSLEELQRLSDDNEFQETTIMKAQDILRSTHAELAVLEVKMALAISEAQKLGEEKQRKIDGAQRALKDCIEEKLRKIDGAQRALEDCVHNLVYDSL